ncbi:hypothetical protein D3C87_1652430 [compost metagenome]
MRLSICIAPGRPRGVWHSPQWPSTSTMYWPRFQASLLPSADSSFTSLPYIMFQPIRPGRTLNGKVRLVTGAARSMGSTVFR